MSRTKSPPPADPAVPADTQAPPADAPAPRATVPEPPDLSWFEQGDVEDDSRIVYLGIQWVNGNPQLKKAGGLPFTGGWFIPADAGVVPVGPAWVQDELVTQEGECVPGYAACGPLGVNVIRIRQSWQVKRRGVVGGARRYAWDQYQAALAHAEDVGTYPRSCADVLCQVQGLSVYATLLHRGTLTRQVSDRGGWLQEARNRLALPTSALVQRTLPSGAARVRLPLLRFTATIGRDVLDDGSPRFSSVGQEGSTSIVTRPRLLSPPAPVASIEEARQYMLPSDVWRAHEAEHYASAAWAEEWSPAALAAQAAQAEAAKPPPKQAPGYQAPDAGADLDETVPY